MSDVPATLATEYIEAVIGLPGRVRFVPAAMAKSFKASARLRAREGVGRTHAATGGALMVIDHARLQSAAWAEFHTVRKRLEKTARDLHRHEEIDIPAYEKWLHRTFPIQITTLRELHAEVSAKAQKIRTVQAQAMYSGGSLKRLWRQQKEREATPEPPPDENERDSANQERTNGRRRYEARPEDFEAARGPAPTADAREIYRRLVQ